MKLRLLCVGRISEPHLRHGIDDYLGRINRYLPCEEIELKEEKGGRKGDTRTLRRREGEQLLGRIPAGAFVIALDEGGKSLSSTAVAALLERHMVGGTPELSWIIGGPYGLSEEVKGRADLLLSLSAMTFTHQMARLILTEQIYRGFTILRHEPYHNR